MDPIKSNDIAKIAGVSRSTVSKVINDYPSISEETKKKVWEAIDKSGYTPDISGRILAGKGTDTLALFLFTKESFHTDLLVSSMISAMIDAAADSNYHILSYIIHPPVGDDAGKMVREVFFQRRADAAIVIGAQNDEPIIEDLIQRGCITSIYDQEPRTSNEGNRLIVNHDHAFTACKCIEYLHSMGHRDIGIINGDLKRYGGKAKQQGFLEGIAKYGMRTKPEWCLQTDFSEDSSYVATREFLEKGHALPTAFAVANDSLAFGAMHAFSEFNITVPDDVSLIANDGHPLAAYMKPGLTTFSYDIHELAASLVDMAIGKLKNPNAMEFRVLEHTFIERDSCKRI